MGLRVRLEGRVGIQPFMPSSCASAADKAAPTCQLWTHYSLLRHQDFHWQAGLLSQETQISEETLLQLSARGLHLLQLIQCYGRLCLLQSTSRQLQPGDKMLMQTMKDSLAVLSADEGPLSGPEGGSILKMMIGVKLHGVALFLLCSYDASAMRGLCLPDAGCMQICKISGGRSGDDMHGTVILLYSWQLGGGADT